jgi:uncharacterized protein YdeI (YjbR/CyaY-like superfamily)
MDVSFFPTAGDLRIWFEKHHDTADQLWIGYYKHASGKPSVTYRESVDEALCFGWIDGIRRSLDAASYANRFTPRRRRSNWSYVNIQRVGELIEAGRMKPAGLKAFEKRDQARSQQYSFENRPATLDEVFESTFRANGSAWEFFSTQAPWYRRTAMFWIMSAKKAETRQRRLMILIEDSEKARRLPMLTPSRSDRSP